MKKRLLAAAAALLLSFSAAIPTMSAYADNGYGEIYDIDEDYYNSGQDDILDPDYDYEGFGYVEEDDSQLQDGDITYDQYEQTRSQPNPLLAFMICLGIGLLIAFIVTSSMKASMRSVHQKTGASDYKKQNGVKLSERRDDFLYNRIEKTPIPQQRQQSPPMQGNRPRPNA